MKVAVAIEHKNRSVFGGSIGTALTSLKLNADLAKC